MGRKREDLSGQIFGDLVVQYRDKLSKKPVKYFCKCTCGGTILTESRNLKSGRVTNCGCKLKKEHLNARKRNQTLCISCIRSAAPPALQCVWDSSKAKILPSGAETVELPGKVVTRTLVVNCPQYLSMYKEENRNLLLLARRQNLNALSIEDALSKSHKLALMDIGFPSAEEDCETENPAQFY